MRLKRDNLSFSKPVVFIALIWLIICFGSSASGGEKKKNLPARGISVALEYTGVVVSEGEDISVDVKVTNLGRQGENIDLTVTSIPEGWNAWIKTYNFGVTGVHVASDKSRSLTLRAEQQKGVGPGKYTFGIKAQTADSKFTSTSQMVITVKGKKEIKKIKV